MSLASGRIEGGQHCFPIRVYYEDTDAAGIVYHANYLKFAERARTEMLRLIGINQSEMRTRYDLAFAVCNCRIDFRRPARLDDLIEVRSHLTELGAAAISGVQVIQRGLENLVQVDVRAACIRRDGRPARIPAPLRQLIEPYIRECERATM